MEWTEPPLPTRSGAFRPVGTIADRVLRTELDGGLVGTLWPTDDFIEMLTALSKYHAAGAEGWERTADTFRSMYARVNKVLQPPLTPADDEVVRMMDTAAADQHRADRLSEAVTAMWATRRAIATIITDAHAALDNGADEDAVVAAAHSACVEANTAGCDTVREVFAEVLPS